MYSRENLLAEIVRIHGEQDLGLDQSKFGTDKLLYKSYLEHLYPDLLAKLPQVRSVVEIGVRGGASLYLWSRLFPQARVLGVDVVGIGQEGGPSPQHMRQDNIEFIHGDAYTTEIADEIPPGIDLLIDDGSHHIADQLRLTELYLDKLSSDGVLVIEDVQDGYVHANIIMKRIPRDKFDIRAHDFRRKKKMYDDFVVCISRGRTPLLYQLYVRLRSKLNVFKHAWMRLTRFWSTRRKAVRE